MPMGLRAWGRSASQPPASFAKLEKPSATPSMMPSATAGAPRVARNAGSREVAASWPQSEKRMARPMPRTPRVSQREGGAVAGFVEMVDMVQRLELSQKNWRRRNGRWNHLECEKSVDWPSAAKEVAKKKINPKNSKESPWADGEESLFLRTFKPRGIPRCARDDGVCAFFLSG